MYILVLRISTYPAGFMSQAADSGHQCKVRSLSMSARQGHDARGIFKKNRLKRFLGRLELWRHLDSADCNKQ